jgi:mannose-6-phosphate isomerase-like protein (cupin superfamily)
MTEALIVEERGRTITFTFDDMMRYHGPHSPAGVAMAFKVMQRAFAVLSPGGPPQRIDGMTIGAARIDGDPPHDGEMHPDGDELLYLLSGAVTVTLELADGKRAVELGAGDAVVVPQGIWHQITMREPAHLLHITPGPNGDARPLTQAEPR